MKTILLIGFLLTIVSLKAQQLAGYAVLPSATFVKGPTSGQFIETANGVAVPFINRQPVQGFSSMLCEGDNTFLVMTDNGFGTKENSPDFVLAVYRLKPVFRTTADDGRPDHIEATLLFNLHDPDGKVNFPLVAEMDNYPGTGKNIPVEPAIKEKRLLTGADFDIESFQRMPDNTFWFGDEFGPFLIHTDSTGKVLSAPVPLPGVQSPQNPFLQGSPNAKRSGGFESLALSADGKMLYPMLEKPLEGDPPGRLNIYRFNPAKGEYTGLLPYRKYMLDTQAEAVTELIALTPEKFMVIERDGKEGPEAEFKKIFLIDFSQVDGEGYLIKQELVDLLKIPDPQNIGGMGHFFTFPFETTEAFCLPDEFTIAVINDNNYPFSVGRHVDSGKPDDSEIILIRFDKSLVDISVDIN
ncbi:MAG: esterase-like activity of phytase family protein [Calditrichia bacterium]